MHSECLLLKIEAEGYIKEVGLENGSVIGEVLISRELAHTYREEIRDKLT
jgi:hypothetical protein